MLSLLISSFVIFPGDGTAIVAGMTGNDSRNNPFASRGGRF